MKTLILILLISSVLTETSFALLSASQLKKRTQQNIAKANIECIHNFKAALEITIDEASKRGNFSTSISFYEDCMNNLSERAKVIKELQDKGYSIKQFGLIIIKNMIELSILDV